MLCEKYTQLSTLEQRTIIGELLHAFQSDSLIFSHCCDILNLAKRKGILDNVIIYPDAIINDKNETNEQSFN